jgi:alpha/beta superfamily hydrolase
MFSAGHGAEVVLVGNSFGSLISLLAASEQRPKGWRASTVGPVGPEQGQASNCPICFSSITWY